MIKQTKGGNMKINPINFSAPTTLRILTKENQSRPFLFNETMKILKNQHLSTSYSNDKIDIKFSDQYMQNAFERIKQILSDTGIKFKHVKF